MKTKREQYITKGVINQNQRGSSKEKDQISLQLHSEPLQQAEAWKRKQSFKILHRLKRKNRNTTWKDTEK